MEETLDEVTAAYDRVPGEFGKFLAGYAPAPGSYNQHDPVRVAEMLKRGAELADIGRRWRTSPTIRGGIIPRPTPNLRITPKF